MTTSHAATPGNGTGSPAEVHRGFAFVEVLLGLTVVAIAAAIAFMVMFPGPRVSHADACNQEANAFRQVVNTYMTNNKDKDKVTHKGKPPQSAPPHGADSIEYVDLMLGDRGFAHIHYVDGTMLMRPTSAHGWTYNYTTGAVNTLGCLKA